MAQLRKIEGQIEIKCNAVKFFDAWAHKLHLNYKELCSNKLSKVELQGGTHQAVGSIIVWNYAVHGKCEIIKTRNKEIDNESLSLAYETIDGDVMKNYYKRLEFGSQVIPKAKGSTVKVTFYYEKMNDDSPGADMYLDFVLSCAKDVDASLCSA